MCPTLNGGGGCVSSATNPTTNVNTRGSDIFKPYSNYIGWGADLGRSSLSTTGVHTQELYAAVMKCRAASNCTTADIGHAVGFSGYQYMFASYAIWPAMGSTGNGPFRVSTCTNSSPSICTSNTSLNAQKPCAGGQTPTLGCTFNVLFLPSTDAGLYQPDFTGTTWTTLNTCTTTSYDPTCVLGTGSNGSNTTNGAVQASYVDDTHFSIPFDASRWGPLTSKSGFFYFYFDFMPIGAHFRLVSAFDVTQVAGCASSGASYCDYIYVLLNTLKNYGMVYLDGEGGGAPGWVVRVNSSEFQTLEEQEAVVQIASYFNDASHPFDTNIEIVDPTSIIARKTARCSPAPPPACPNDATATTGRITVTATNAKGSASVDVIPEGTAVGVYPEYLSMAGGTRFQLEPWVSGNTNTGVTYSCCTSATSNYPLISGVSVSSRGLITAPTTRQINAYLTNNSNVLPQAIITISSAAD